MEEMMARWMIAVAVLACCAGVTACSAVHRAEEAVADVEQRSSQTEAYALNAESAREVVLGAIREGWPSVEPKSLHDGRIGYEFVLHFAIDRERIIVEALPAGDGHLFQVTNRGTAPAVGVPARKKLISLLEKRAPTAILRP
jgi:hypothetical protein